MTRDAKNGLPGYPRYPGFPGRWIQDNYQTKTLSDIARELNISLRAVEKRCIRMRRDGYLPPGPKKRVTKSATRGPVITVKAPDLAVVSKYVEKSLNPTPVPPPAPPAAKTHIRVRDVKGGAVNYRADSSSVEEGALCLWGEREGKPPVMVARYSAGSWHSAWTVGSVT